uniref:CARD domain-containing protein n=1 Tax=Hymenolepis diminuta TaxID=6216 RepID=A0A0R3SZM6_HYMDI
LLEKRVASWQRFQSLRAILSAASLEEVRSLAIPLDTKSRFVRCHLSRSEEVPRLVRALFRPSNARSTLLKDLAESS